MVSSPNPYNITISTQCANFQFQPQRDGPIDQGWNVTYSQSIDSNYTFNAQGQGESSHRTTLSGAYVELEWTGTAAYIYGNTTPNSVYSITVNGQPSNGGPDLIQNLLGSATGLPYGDHTIRVTSGDNNELSVSGAIFTIGVGSDG
jgi:glycosidase